MALGACPDNVATPDDEVSELQRIAQQDEQTFETLYLRYHPKLYRFVQGLLKNPSQVEEVVSDTLYAVWTGAGKFQNQSKVSTWIFGTAFRIAMKAVRAGRRHTRFDNNSEDAGVLMDLNTSNDPAIGATLSEDVSNMVSALNGISPEQKAVVELTALGWTSAEIGEIVGCPANTVKTRMFSARKKIRTILDSI
ncbi:MAG: sigma-70 family RNA polymerase sigma factor [Granulosicoccaceae bacterium]